MTRKRTAQGASPGSATVPAGAHERAQAVLDGLIRRYPEAGGSHLDAANPWQLLVATVLAAQCTDARVNLVTPALFRRWPDPAALTAAGQEELEEIIRPTGFYRNKAKNLLGAAAMVVRDFGGVVPAVMADLVRLPGVARKTANCVLWGGYGINEGLAVDTHVKRIAFRLGLTAQEDPDAVERDLMHVFPREEWGGVNHRMVLFGREVCDARKPMCEACPFAVWCPRNGV